MTLDELEQNLENMEQSLYNLTPILTEIGNDMTAKLRADAASFAWKDSTGALASSISLTVQPDSFGISMYNYGAFQNFGVIGFEGGGKNQSQDNPKSFNNNNKFKFGTGNYSRGGRPWGAYYSGLNAKRWFDMDDITNDVTTRLQQELNNIIQ